MLLGADEGSCDGINDGILLGADEGISEGRLLGDEVGSIPNT